MTGKREMKRQALTDALIDAAISRIASGGLQGLRARDLAEDAKCALGSLYTVFRDLDELILRVNSMTLGMLSQALEEITADAKSPAAELVRLASGYLAFAVQHKNLWEALFEHKMPEGVEVPQWHLQEHSVLFKHIAKPLGQILPDIDDEELGLQAKTMFAAVHGIVSISLQGRFIAVPLEALDKHLRQFVETHVKGLTADIG